MTVFSVLYIGGYYPDPDGYQPGQAMVKCLFKGRNMLCHVEKYN